MELGFYIKTRWWCRFNMDLYLKLLEAKEQAEQARR